MVANTAEKSYSAAADEKIAPVMVYSPIGICWGDVIVKEKVRVSTWLRTNAAPDYVCLHDARYLITTAPTDAPKPLSFSEFYFPVQQVQAFHLVPPSADPVDYDPSEPNRKMEPVTAIVGTFRVDGFLRISSISTAAKYLEVIREAFTPLYNVEIRNSLIPRLGVIRAPYLLVRQQNTLFAPRNA